MRTDEMVLLGIIFLLAFALPIYAAAMAYKRGKNSWGMASLISLFFGMGWLIGALVLLSLRNIPPADIPSDVPCPECKSTSVATKFVIEDAHSGQELYSMGFVIVAGGIFLIAGILLAYAGIYGLITPPSTSGVTLQWTLFGFRVSEDVIDLLFLVMGLGIIGSMATRGIAYFRATKLHVLKYTCRLCGHTWEKATVIPTTRRPSHG